MRVRQLLAFALFLATWSLAAFAQAPAPRRPPSEDELWQRVEKANDAQMLEAFISAFPSSRYLADARKRLAALKPGSAGTAPGRPQTTTEPSSRTTTTTIRPPTAAHEPSPSLQVLRLDVFDEPRQGPRTGKGIRVDWCPRWANDCGKPAADAFCRSQGFAAARSFADELTGGPTWVLGDRQICAMNDCRALRRVECEGAGTPNVLATEETFEAPRVNGLALSSCLTAAGGCGLEAASAFCAAAGYASAKAFGEVAGGAPSPIRLGDRTLCSGRQCRSITHVVCTR